MGHNRRLESNSTGSKFHSGFILPDEYFAPIEVRMTENIDIFLMQPEMGGE